MVLSTDVTQFLSSAQALYTPGSRLLIKYKGTGVLTLKVTDNKQALTYRSKQKDDLKHMDKLSLAVLTASTSSSASAAGGGAGSTAASAASAPAHMARKAAPGSGAQRRKLAIQARLAQGKGRVGARTLARQQAKAAKEKLRSSRRQERREERMLAEGMAAAAAAASAEATAAAESR